METSIEYKPVAKIPASVRETASEYDQVVDQFVADTETKFAEVSKPDVKAISLASALRTRISKKKLDNKVGVKQRKGKVYLVKL